MLYPTHQRYGQVFGLGGAAIGASLGLLPVVALSDFNSFSELIIEVFVVLLYVYVCYSGSVFGSEFPDIDSPGSIPARKHFFIQKLFKLFQVKHRGKFSHDFTSLFLLFGSLYLVVHLLFAPLMSGLLSLGVSNSDLMPLIALLSTDGLLSNLLEVYIIFTLLGAYSHLIADASTKQGVWIFWSLKVHIVPVFITRITIGGKQPFSQIFNTGTGWEMRSTCFTTSA